MAKQKTGKRPDKRPARARYWTNGTLERHKVRNLMRCNGMTRADATEYWREVRTTRMRTFR